MEITIDNNYHTSRLDRFIREKYSIPQSLVSRLIREKKIKVNKKKSQPSTILHNGDTISIYYFLEEHSKQIHINPSLVKQFISWIIFEDENIIIINKPHGISSQGGITSGISVDILAKQYNEEARITHRLDRETSGTMIIAKNKHTARHITGLFAKNLINKKYYAMVEQINQKHGTIVSDLQKNPTLQKILVTQGNSCTTHFEKFSENILLITPQTGKMHQIRAHLSHIGMPIIGDSKYGGIQSTRMFLHSFSIEFEGKIFTSQCDFI
jgi:23S rRNA pseudouridine955/2504/2580 synthase